MNAIRTLSRRMRYKTKLMLCYLCSILLPILFGLIYLYNTMVSNAGQPLLNTIYQRMEQERSGVEKTVEDMQKSAHLLSTQTDINRFFIRNYYDPVELIKTMNYQIMPTLSWYDANSKFGQQFRFITQNTYLPENEFWEQAARYTGEAWYQNAVKKSSGGYYREAWHPSRDYLYTSHKNNLVYTWFYPLLSSGAGNLTLLEVSIDAEHIFEGINEAPIAESGFLFTCYNDKLIYTGGLQADLAKWLQSEQGRRLINETEIKETIYMNGKSYYLSTLRIKNLDTVLGCIVPQEEIDAPARAARNGFAAVSLGIILAILLISYVVATFLLQRIQRILAAVKTIQKGNFDIRIPLYGEDEIDELAQEINIMAGKIDELINTVYLSENLQKESQLAALQSQINPHFLFNTLETMKMAAELGETERLKTGLTSLGGLMRYTLSAAKNPVSLDIELRNLSYYMNIQNMLLDDRIRFRVDIPEDLQKKVRILPLTLQPILENSIQHGFKRRIGILEIMLTFEQSEAGTLLTVSDNGSGITEKTLINLLAELKRDQQPQNTRARGGIGLWNVNRRLILTFGESSALQITQNPMGGVITRIFLPKDNISIEEESQCTDC